MLQPEWQALPQWYFTALVNSLKSRSMSVLQTKVYTTLLSWNETFNILFLRWSDFVNWHFHTTLLDELYIKIQVVNVKEILHNAS